MASGIVFEKERKLAFRRTVKGSNFRLVSSTYEFKIKLLRK